MKVLIGKKTWEMSKSKYKKLLVVAKEQVPKGIYAIENGDYAELRCDTGSITKIKRLKREFRMRGFKVYTNGI